MSNRENRIAFSVSDHGIVTLPGGAEIEVNFFKPDAAMREVLKKRGLTDTEMDRGVANVKSGDYESGTMKHVVFDANDQVRVVNVDRGFGRTRYEPTLTQEESLALGAVSQNQRISGEDFMDESGTAETFAQVFGLSNRE